MKVFFKILILILCFTFGHKANANNISIERVETLVSDSAETDSLKALVANRNPKQHMTFMGIPITGTIEQFSEKLIVNGYRYDHELGKGAIYFDGTFMDESNCSIAVEYNPYTEIVYSVSVFLNHCSYDQAMNKYVRFFSQLTNKYQKRLQGGKNLIGDIKGTNAYFDLGNGSIYLGIFFDDEVRKYYNVISYTDRINYKNKAAKNKQMEHNEL